MFDREGVYPKVADSVELVDGYIENTLPKYMAEHPELKVAFVHSDTDTHSPASTVLTTLKPHFAPGAVIVFDELCGYPNWRSHEYRALRESFSPDEYEFLGFSVGARRINLMNAAIRLL